MHDNKDRFTMKNKTHERKNQYIFTTEFTENTEKDNIGESANYCGNTRSNSPTAVLTLRPPYYYPSSSCFFRKIFMQPFS